MGVTSSMRVMVMPARVRARMAAWAPGPVLLERLPPGARYLTMSSVNSLSRKASAMRSAERVAANWPPLSLPALTTSPPLQVVMVSAPVKSVAVMRMLL